MADEPNATASTTETPATPALVNTPEARTPAGELKDQTPSLTSTAEPEKKPEAKTEPEAKAEEAKPAEGAPEKYEFKAPEGTELDAKAIEAATPIFKELNLSQDQAQKLVDLYSAQTKAQAEAPIKAFTDLVTGWRNEVIKDPSIGNGKDGLADNVSKAIGNAINGLGQTEAAAFRDVLDKTGLGNNPTFIKGLYGMVKDLGEGRHVAGKGPTEPGTRAPGSPQTAAQRMYPDLPSASAR